ncbi:MAG: hypothetical protein R3C03_20940 [Pirellulaceae bacterium]
MRSNRPTRELPQGSHAGAGAQQVGAGAQHVLTTGRETVEHVVTGTRHTLRTVWVTGTHLVYPQPQASRQRTLRYFVTVSQVTTRL